MKKQSVISQEMVRKVKRGIDKYQFKKNLTDSMCAEVTHRELKRLHTYFPGQRAELDHTHPSLLAFPNEQWTEPLTYHLGLGTDHSSGVIKGHTLTTAPSGADTIRLYRRCVLPKLLWLPPELSDVALEWDVFGLDDLVAIDNGPENTSAHATLSLLHWGTIVLRLPPNRPDLKGGHERTNKTVEDQFLRTLPGFIPSNIKRTSHEYKRVLAKARREAKFLAKEVDAQFSRYVCEFNCAPHPRLKKPRIQVWREGQERAPILLPTGDIQLRSAFALTFHVSVSRQGVQVLELTFNSSDLHKVWLHYSGKVTVKLNPDDIRTVLVFVPKYVDPIEATLTTHEPPDFPVSLELYRFNRKREQDAASARGNHAAHPALEGDLKLCFMDSLEAAQAPLPASRKEEARAIARVAGQTIEMQKAPEDAPMRPKKGLSDFMGNTELPPEELQ